MQLVSSRAGLLCHLTAGLHCPPPEMGETQGPSAVSLSLEETHRRLLSSSTNAVIDVPWGQMEAQTLPGNVRGSFPEERTFELNLET